MSQKRRPSQQQRQKGEAEPDHFALFLLQHPKSQPKFPDNFTYTRKDKTTRVYIDKSKPTTVLQSLAELLSDRKVKGVLRELSFQRAGIRLSAEVFLDRLPKPRSDFEAAPDDEEEAAEENKENEEEDEAEAEEEEEDGEAEEDGKASSDSDACDPPLARLCSGKDKGKGPARDPSPPPSQRAREDRERTALVTRAIRHVRDTLKPLMRKRGDSKFEGTEDTLWSTVHVSQSDGEPNVVWLCFPDVIMCRQLLPHVIKHLREEAEDRTRIRPLPPPVFSLDHLCGDEVPLYCSGGRKGFFPGTRGTISGGQLSEILTVFQNSKSSFELSDAIDAATKRRREQRVAVLASRLIGDVPRPGDDEETEGFGGRNYVPGIDMRTDAVFNTLAAKSLWRGPDDSKELIAYIERFFAHVPKDHKVMEKCIAEISGVPYFKSHKTSELPRSVYTDLIVKVESVNPQTGKKTYQPMHLLKWYLENTHTSYVLGVVVEPGKRAVVVKKAQHPPNERRFQLNIASWPRYYFVREQYRRWQVDPATRRRVGNGDLTAIMPPCDVDRDPFLALRQGEGRTSVEDALKLPLPNPEVDGMTYRVVMNQYFGRTPGEPVLETWKRMTADRRGVRPPADEEGNYDWEALAESEGAAFTLKIVLFHIWFVYCRERPELFMVFVTFMCKVMFTPMKKTGIVPVLVGMEGVGKSSFIESLAEHGFGIGTVCQV